MQSIRYRGRARHSDQERAEIITGFKRSGLTQSAYCGQIGINTATLYNWRRRLGREVIRLDPAGAKGFLEVTPMVSALARPAEIRIEIKAGPVSMALPMGVPASWVAELVRGLQCGA